MPQDLSSLPEPSRSCSLCHQSQSSTQEYIRRLEEVNAEQRAELERLKIDVADYRTALYRNTFDRLSIDTTNCQE